MRQNEYEKEPGSDNTDLVLFKLDGVLRNSLVAEEAKAALT